MAYENKLDSVYGMEGVLNIIGNPEIAKRAPTSKDKAPIGKLWVNKVSHTSYVCCGSGSKVTYWSTTALTDPGAVNVGGILTAAVGLVVTAGGITCGGNLAASGFIIANGTVSAGTNLIAAGTVTAGTSIEAGTTLTATLGNITATNGNVVISTAAKYLQLPGPVKIMSGAGVPANGLAAAAGDMYIRTDPAAAASRLYIATAANTWTNVTCAA